MKTPTFFSSIRKSYQASQKQRSILIAQSNQALSMSKRSIFALHRGDVQSSEKLLDDASAILKKVEPIFKMHPQLEYQGAYRAALEEHAEALLFFQFIKSGKFEKLEGNVMDAEVFIGGLSDASGEIVRYAVRRATDGDFEAVKKSRDAVEMIIEFMLKMDLAGHLRQKFDQTKKNLRSLEGILYDASLKK